MIRRPSQHLSAAQSVALKAVEADTKGELQRAVGLYMEATELLLQELKDQREPRIQTALRRKADEYLTRAEILRKPVSLQRLQDSRAHLAPSSSSQRRLTADAELKHRILDEVLDSSPGVAWEDVAGLEVAKQIVKEAVILPMLRPDIFTGLRAPPKGVLFFGPPGTGKTHLAKAIASQAQATFFSISASSITSKWVGEGEKLVRALFELARELQPAVIFIDEIDALLSARSEGEDGASRRIKTEFLVQLDGVGTNGEERVLVLGATNRPWELDPAVLRRLSTRVYIPLPDEAARQALIEKILPHRDLKSLSMKWLLKQTEGDLKALCRDAALGPVREVKDIQSVRVEDLRPISRQDFSLSLQRIRPSVAPASLSQYEHYNQEYGVKG